MRDKPSLFSRVLSWLQLILTGLIVVAFVGCCYMADKFRWTL